jgi:hypothetical protein
MPTTIKLKNSVTTTSVPSSLVQGEVAINVTDKKVWVGNAATTPIQIAGAGTTGNAAGSNTQVQYNSSGSFAGSANFTFNGTTVTMANDASISGLTVGKGGGAVSTNTAIGYQAINASATGGTNTAVGYQAVYSNTTGTANTALGLQALYANTTAGSNTAIGYQSAVLNTTGANNTAIGESALRSNTTASNNTAVGYQAGYYNTTGTQHTLLGGQAGYSLTTATNNVNVGYVAGRSNQTGDGVIAIGAACLYSNTASYNTAVGAGNTMYANTTGSSNVAVGGNDATANGTMRFNTTGSYNTAIGIGALGANTTASRHTAVGYQAGYSVTTNDAVTAVGYLAGNANTGGFSVFVGRNAGYVSTASKGTMIGDGAGSEITSGANNTILGRYTGNQGGLDIRTASNWIVLSDGDGNPRARWSDVGAAVFKMSATDTYSFDTNNAAATRPYGVNIQFGGATPNNTTQTFLDCQDTTNTKLTIYSSGTVTNRTGTYNAFSDIKLKQDVVDAGSQWDDIKAVRVRKFRLKDEVAADSNTKPLIGVIAQELEKTSAGLIDDTYDKEGVLTKSVKYSILYMKAVKALQEAMERIETLEAKVQQLENK